MSFFKRAKNILATGNIFTNIGRDQNNFDRIDNFIQNNTTNNYYQHSLDTTGGSGGSGLNAEALSKVNYKPNPSALFQGRKDELNQLKAYFKPRSADEPVSRRSLLLYGMGGIGKTQICLKFAKRMATQYTHIFWIDASTAETLTLGLKSIANSVQGAQAAALDGSPESVLKWMSLLEQNWLLVLDNADDQIHKFIPSGNSGDILITSRNRAIRRHTASDLEIERMSEDDAISLLMKASYCKDPSSDALQNAARAIVKELCCLPLAVDQAGAFIDSGRCTMESYLKVYFKCRQQLLDDAVFKSATPYEQTVYGTWEVSYQRIEAEASQEININAQAYRTAIVILETFAFFHHDHLDEDIFKHASQNVDTVDKDITEEQWEKLNPTAVSVTDHGLLCKDKYGNWDDFQFRNGVQILLSFSLIKQYSPGTVYAMHPLVHLWSQDRMPYSDQQQNCKKVRALLSRSISQGTSSDWQSHDYLFSQSLIPHVAANSNYFGLQEEFNNNEYSNFASLYFANGYYKKSEELNIKIAERREKVLGKNHEYTLDNLVNLASTYLKQGKWQEAEKLQLQVLNLRKRSLGEDHPYTSIIMSNLALTYRKQRKWQEAEKLQLQVLNLWKGLLGEEHPYTLTIRSNLALTYSNQGKWQEAENLQLQDLTLSQRLLGEEHPDTLISMNNIASTYRKQGKWQEAENLQLKVLNLWKKLLGEEHPDTLTSMNNLAFTYKAQGRWEEAENLMVQAFEMRKKVLGKNHPETVNSMNVLAKIYEHNGKQEAVKMLHEQANNSKKDMYE